MSLAGEVSQGTLGEILAIDSTTLTRTLAIMERQGWIASRPGKDRRERWLSLSKAGKVRIQARASPLGKSAAGVPCAAREQALEKLLNLTNEVTAEVTE